MKKLILIFISILLIAGCNSQAFAEKEARCIAYQDTIEENIQYENTLTDNPSPSHQWIFELKEIFFSEKLETCVYVEERGLYDGPTNAASDYIVKDFYNNTELNAFSIKTNREFTGEIVEYEKYIEEIKEGGK